MPLISVITPVYRANPIHLDATTRGVLGQCLPRGWAVEWIIQEDGPESSIKRAFPPRENLSYEANGEHLGVAASRNIALSRARGELIQVLDHDDVLLPHALATLVPHFANDSIHWAVGQADNLNEDGTRTSWESVLPFGPVEAGHANSVAIEPHGNWVIHCAGLSSVPKLFAH